MCKFYSVPLLLTETSGFVFTSPTNSKKYILFSHFQRRFANMLSENRWNKRS